MDMLCGQRTVDVSRTWTWTLYVDVVLTEHDIDVVLTGFDVAVMWT